MYVLELFSGFECMSNAFREKGHYCFTVDWDIRFNSNLHKDISKLTLDDLPKEFRTPDVVFCGTDCTTYSVAAISRHRRKNPITGNLDPISKKAQMADDMNRYVKQLIEKMNPKVVIWENPVGGLRKMDFMQGYIRNTTTYCQYGFSYRKATDFFSNIDLKLKPPCKNGSPCHEKAPRGAKSGIQRIKDAALKSVYPPELCKHIVNMCEEYITNKDKEIKKGQYMEQMTIFDLMENGHLFKPKESTDWKWKFADYPREKNGIKVFSCFACGGGSTMGYKLAGCDVLGCCEIDKTMNDIYIKNHHPKYNYLMDIRDFNKIPDDEIPEELFNLDILDGSPPCTTFSMAGDREDSWGKKKKFREGQKEQTLDDLSFVFIDTIKKLRPKVVIMENVEGLLLGEAWSYVQKIYKGFIDAGYRLNHWLLKGEKMGVPQTRHRVFFIAIRNDLNIDPSGIDMYFNYRPITYGEIRSGEGKPLSPDTQAYKYIKLATPKDKRVIDVLARLGEKERCFGQKIAWNENVLQTIPANLDYTCGDTLKSISNVDVIHAQTFPEDYDFEEFTFDRISYVCGMSVPPIMIKRIVQRLIDEKIFDYKNVESNT